MSQEPVLFNCSIEENIAYGFNGKASSSDVETVAVSMLFSFPFFSFSKINLLFFFNTNICANEVMTTAENG